MFFEVAVNLAPVRGTFHYHAPPALEPLLSPGHLVIVPFGPRRLQGIVLRRSAHSPVPETKPIESLLDPKPVLTPAQLRLAHWLSQETLSPLIDCLTLMVPPGLAQRADTRYTLLDEGARSSDKVEARLIAQLRQRGPLRGRQIRRALARMNWQRAADRLVRAGVLARAHVLEPPAVRPQQILIAALTLDAKSARQAVARVGRQGSQAAARRRAVVEALIAAQRPLEAKSLTAETGARLGDLRQLEQAGILKLESQQSFRDPLADYDFVPSTPPPLTPDQAAAWERVQMALEQPNPEPILLHGVTGSGKTEIYLRAVEAVLQQGRGAIALVPEIALTPQTVRRFLSRFGTKVGLLHSRLSAGQRFDTWRRIREGELPVVVGPRSALFAPLPHIGLIVLDECHDESYKEQGQAPRYHARETALAYARQIGALCILGSATPEVVTMYRARAGQLQHITLQKRIRGHRQRLQQQATRLGRQPAYRPESGLAETLPLPPVRIVDMRHELRMGNSSIFSRALQQALRDCLEAGEQAILFLNRRGRATYVFCRDCGHVIACPQCQTPLTDHRQGQQLLCHHCGYHRRPPRTCPQCASPRVRYFGAGTERVEEEVHRLLPGVRTLRWDWDTTRTKGAHDRILGQFAAHKADVLIGTQMIAKGLDLPLVTLVGVVSADTGLNLPDYRAPERTFQLLTQVAGRAGRGILGGRAILQTYQPDHYAIQAAAQHDYQAFFHQELRARQELGYPPFGRLVRLLYRHARAAQAEHECARMAQIIHTRRRQAAVQADIIGPAPCFYTRLRGYYRWHIVLRGADPRPLIPSPLPEGWAVDIDPVSLL
jgi:primosomal protein N' (replication factor Y)